MRFSDSRRQQRKPGLQSRLIASLREASIEQVGSEVAALPGRYAIVLVQASDGRRPDPTGAVLRAGGAEPVHAICRASSSLVDWDVEDGVLLLDFYMLRSALFADGIGRSVEIYRLP